MRMHQTTPTIQQSLSRVLLVGVLPLLIYALQMLSRAYGLAALIAAVLVVLKVVLDLRHTPYVRRPARRRRPRRTHRPADRCCYCQSTRRLFAHPDPARVLPQGTRICPSCYERHLLTATYMSTHFEPL